MFKPLWLRIKKQQKENIEKKTPKKETKEHKNNKTKKMSNYSG